MRHLVLYRRYTSGDLLSGGVRWDSSPSPIFGSSGYLIPKCMEEKQIICSFLISKEFFLLAFSAESFPRWGESSLNITSTPRRKLMVTTSETISFFKPKKYHLFLTSDWIFWSRVTIIYNWSTVKEILYCCPRVSCTPTSIYVGQKVKGLLST